MHHTGGCWLACMLAPGLNGARQALTEHPEVKEGVQLREYQIYALIEGKHLLWRFGSSASCVYKIDIVKAFSGDIWKLALT